ncbi:MAG: GMC family oxidoreductase [Hyphomonadaceae bacterium]|nr:GMC family oxidoreductase [Hyphomonadaceae bacterium]
MIIDARSIDSSSIIESDLCIVGAGAAGIAIALEFMKKSDVSVVLLESGGEKLDPATQSLNGGHQLGVAYDDLEASRSRFLGGATNCWGGWCRPLDELDFQVRDWIPNSGWPFGKAELLPYYERSHAVLQLKPFAYDVSAHADLLKERGLAPLPLGSKRLDNMLVHLSGPARFGKAYRDQLRRASNVKLLLMANATEICTDHAGTNVTGVRVATLSGKKFSVMAKIVVLAAGGIENPRLLLLSNQVQTKGLGNGADLVGRYFMDHPRIRSSRVRLEDLRRFRRLYDNQVALQRGDKQDTRLTMHLAPTAETQRALRIPNSRTYIAQRYAQDASKGFQAARRFTLAVRACVRFGRPLGACAKEAARTIPTLIANAPAAAIGSVAVRHKPSLLREDFSFESVLEPIPNYDSRVTLAPTRDRLGLNQVNVDWRLTDADRRHFDILCELLNKDALTRDGLHLVGDPVSTDTVWPSKLGGCWHHMGTTRMDANPAKGVVGPDGRVHGISNLFIAGSSVFPTSGSDMPTITIVALALRLCDRLNAMLRSESPRRTQLDLQPSAPMG